ncbi:MAG: T9SS type A sorting domain-containing protein [Muribaculaceae bacterium]|nr:T9SS type A sorting domain-containing protein [Muribaculaceae bacterium]
MRNFVLTVLLGVGCAAVGQNPYISKVYEFCPAPGQFVNEVPEAEDGVTYEEMLEVAAEALCGSANAGMVSLGSFGGYVVFGFDHPVVNRHGFYDFKINGNAVISDTQAGGGSCEPGIVMVSVDTNGNGLPDDEWYELAGSEYEAEGTKHNYTVTYHHPDADKTPVKDPDRKYITDAEYILWTDSEGASGYVTSNSSHTQSYWPMWLEDTAAITFKGTCLAPNGESLNESGTNYLLRMLPWGYADNEPNASGKGFNLDWAVNSDGQSVLLEQVDFIRVHTGTLQQCGWLGEASTEVTGAVDLHPEYTYSPEWPDNPEDPYAVKPGAGVGTLLTTSLKISRSNLKGNYNLESDKHCAAILFDITGRPLHQFIIEEGNNSLDLSQLPEGLYILTTTIGNLRILR